MGACTSKVMSNTTTKKSSKIHYEQCEESITEWNDVITETNKSSAEWRSTHPDSYGCGLTWIQDGYSGMEWRKGHYLQINRIRDRRWMPERLIKLTGKTSNWQYAVVTCGSREKWIVNEYTVAQKSSKGERHLAPRLEHYFCRDCQRRVEGDFTTATTDESAIENEFADDPSDDSEIVIEGEDEVVVDAQGTIARRVRARKGNRAAIVLYDKKTGAVLETSKVDDVDATRKQAIKDAKTKYKSKSKPKRTLGERLRRKRVDEDVAKADTEISA